MRKLTILFLFLALSACVTGTKKNQDENDDFLDNEPKNTVIAPEPSIGSEELLGCNTEFGFLPSGMSLNAYAEEVPTQKPTCISETRTCLDGKLTGSFTYLSCMERPDISVTPEVKVISPAQKNEEPPAAAN